VSSRMRLPKRIAVVHNLPAGGAKRCLYEQLRIMRGRYSVEVFQLASPFNAFMPLEPFADKVHEFPLTRLVPPGAGIAKKIAGDLQFNRALRRAWRAVASAVNAGGFDLAFVHHCRVTQSPLVLPYLEVPSVYFCQEPPRALYEPSIARPYDMGSAAGLRGLVYRVRCAAFKRWDVENVAAATVIEVNSRYSAEVIYRTYGRDPVVCLLGVDTSTFRPLGVARERMVLSVGSLSPTKAHDLTIAALGRIPAERRPRLVLAGPVGKPDAAEELFLRELARDRGVEFEIVSFPDDEALCALYNRAWATVYVPRLEPFGLVPLESQACGTPVVGVAEGGVRETVVDGVTGILCERSAESCAAGIERLMAEPALARRLGQAGVEVVRAEWTWRRTLASMERGFADALERGRPARPRGDRPIEDVALEGRLG
jgi:glycosyltransferase involved in cell wall biosynthesis